MLAVYNFLFVLGRLQQKLKKEGGDEGASLEFRMKLGAEKKGCFSLGSSAISINRPSGDVPEKIMPAFSISVIYSGLTSYLCLCLSEIVASSATKSAIL